MLARYFPIGNWRAFTQLMMISTGSSSQRSYVFLAPQTRELEFAGIQARQAKQPYYRLLAESQRLRGRIYLEDGAIGASELTNDGRYVTDLDRHSWHLLTLGQQGRVMGCARFLRHSQRVGFQELTVAHTPLATSAAWGPKLKKTVESQLALSRTVDASFIELGGWALTEELRGTAEALIYVLISYAWSRQLGGALGLTTATVRNGSAKLLKKVGGKPLTTEDGEEIPPYFDHRYNCGMEILSFDSRLPHSKFAGAVNQFESRVSDFEVLRAEEAEVADEDAQVRFAPELLPANRLSLVA